jgi:hypothetical protein
MGSNRRTAAAFIGTWRNGNLFHAFTKLYLDFCCLFRVDQDHVGAGFFESSSPDLASSIERNIWTCQERDSPGRSVFLSSAWLCWGCRVGTNR